MQWFKCLFGKHKPDRSRVRHDGYEFYGPCAGCGVEMVKGTRGWEVADYEDEPEEELSTQPQRD